MGIGISCKSGPNLRLGEMITNYATNRLETKKQRKKDNLNRSKSESSLISTKSKDQSTNDQFESRKRKKIYDEHQASQVLYLNLANNVNLFMEKLNCDLCLQKYLDENGIKEMNDERMILETKLNELIDQSNSEKNDENDNQMYDDDQIENDSLDDSIKTVKSMKTDLSQLDNQDLDLIDRIDNESMNSKRLSSIDEEIEYEINQSIIHQSNRNVSDSLRPCRSSVKVQMNSLNRSSQSLKNNRLIFSNERKMKLKSLNKKQNSFDKQNDDEKQETVDTFEKKLPDEQIQSENNSFSNSFYNETSDDSNINLIRSFSADHLNDLLDEEKSSNEMNILHRAIKFNKIKNQLIMYLSDGDLTKLMRDEIDCRSTISTLRTELLNLDSIGKELKDRDQLENVLLDNDSNVSTKSSEMKLNFKIGLADTLLTAQLSKLNRHKNRRQLVTKTNRTEQLNKRSFVNQWLKREQNLFIQDLNYQLFNNQTFNRSFDQIVNCDEDCNLCGLNDEKLNELDKDVLELMKVLQALDEILHEKEIQLEKLAEKADQSPKHLNICSSINKQKSVCSRANLKRRVNMIKKRSLGISMCKNENGKQLIVFKDGKSTYHIEIGNGE